MLSKYKNKAIADRYPDPPPKPTAWCGWRRKKGSSDAWELVADTEKPTKGECYQRLMEVSELVGMDQVEWEYAICPKGERPRMPGPGEGRMR